MPFARMCCVASNFMRPAVTFEPRPTPLRMNAVRHRVMAAAQLEAKQLLRKAVKQALRQMDDADRQRQSAWQCDCPCWTLWFLTLHPCALLHE